MAPSDLAERLAFLFPTTCGAGQARPAVPDPDELRRLVSSELGLPPAANRLEEAVLATFVSARTLFATMVLRDTDGAWEAVLRLIDEGLTRDEILEQVHDVVSEHVIEPIADGREVDDELVADALARLGRWDPRDDEIERLPWLIDEWRSSGRVADDEIAGIVRDVIHPEVLDVIGDQVCTLDQVADRFARRLRLPPAECTAAVGMYLEWFSNAVVVTPRGNVARTEAVLGGVRFRHVLSDAEAATERLEVGTDLAVTLDDIDTLRLPDGAIPESTFRTAADGPESRRGLVHVVSGPPGWLGGAQAGEQVAISRRGGQLIVERVEPAETSAVTVAALAAAQRDLDLPTDIYRLVGVAATDSGGFGDDLGAPLTELLELAGWSVRDEQVAEVGYDWDAAQAEASRRGRASVLDAAGVAPALGSRVEALVEELFGPGRWFCATEVVDVADERVPAVARLLGRDGVAGAVWSLGVGPDPDPPVAKRVLDLAQDLLDRSDRTHATGPARLALLAAGQLDRVDLLPGLLELAAVDDCADPGLCAVGADVAIDRGDLTAARRHQQRGWLPPSELLVQHGRSERFYTAGRNEPCPCGSGKKHKRCHGDVRTRMPTDEERAQLLAIRLDQHASRRLRTTHRLAKRAGLLEDDEWWVDGGQFAVPFLRAVQWFAGGVLADHLTSRGALLSDADRALEESWADARLVVGTCETAEFVTLGDGREVPTLSGIGGSLVLPFGATVGWEVPVGGRPTFLFGTTLGGDVTAAADRFAGLKEPGAIADALAETWWRGPSRTAARRSVGSDVC